MIRTLLAAATLLSPLPANCAGTVDEPAQRVDDRPDCTGEVILHYSWDEPFDCDVNPPQTIVIRIDEMQSDYDRCHDSGGQILYDDEVYAIYCINLDY